MSDPLDLLTPDQADLLEEAAVPAWTEPMLATLVDEAFSDPDWIYERKLDGERCLAFHDGDRLRLRSRNRRTLEGTYPELLDPLRAANSDRFVVDGEVVAFEGAVTSFGRLQQRMQIEDPDEAKASGVAVFYYLFDVLHLSGHDTNALALRDRKRLLEVLFDFADPLRFTAHRNEEGERFYEEACARGWEGLIAKDATAPYVHSRSKKWQKLKCVHRQEFVIVGFTEPEGERHRFGAILIAYHDGDDLVYAGKVGTGFDEDTLQDLGDRMESLARDEPAIDRGDPPSEGVHWIDPELVGEVGFTEWTTGGKLRHPRYLGLRRDKDPGDVVREVPA